MKMVFPGKIGAAAVTVGKTAFSGLWTLAFTRNSWLYLRDVMMCCQLASLSHCLDKTQFNLITNQEGDS